MATDGNSFLAAKLQTKRRGTSRKRCHNRKRFPLLTLHGQQTDGWSLACLHLEAFAVTAAALGAKVKIQVASLGLCGQLMGTPDHEDGAGYQLLAVRP